MEEKRGFTQEYTIHLLQEEGNWRGTLISGEEKLPFQGLDALWAMLCREAPMEQPWRWALIDPLTGVLNRRGVELQLSPYCKRANTALLFLDLDWFKSINDSQGHRAGDEALQRTAAAIQGCLLPMEQIGRVGGDEFIILLHQVEHREDVFRRAEEIRQSVALTAGVSVSIGLSWAARPLSYELLFEMADKALYSAKRNGKNQAVFYDDALETCFSDKKEGDDIP